jgi:hypothetical protein
MKNRRASSLTTLQLTSTFGLRAARALLDVLAAELRR